MACKLRIGGMVRCSACDWPGHLVSTIFCQGCTWACRYCQNPELIAPQGKVAYNWEKILAFLEKRRGLLDGVIFSGGEPSVQGGLADAVEDIRAMGLKVGLHTAGAAPARLAGLWERLDWVGFDVKAPFGHYAPITGCEAGEAVRESLEQMLGSGLPYEVRTTVHPHLLSPEMLETLGHQLADMGVQHWVVQAFRPTGCLDPALAQGRGPLPALSEGLQRRFASFNQR